MKTTNLDPTRCCEQIREPGVWPRWHQCRRKHTVNVDGKPFCGVHNPAAKAKRLEDARAKWANESDRAQQRHNCLVACAGMKDPVAEVEAMKKAITASRFALLTINRLTEGQENAGDDDLEQALGNLDKIQAKNPKGTQ